MLSDFEEFLTLWRALAAEAGDGGLPTRQQLTTGQFCRFIPVMLIVEWDTKTWTPAISYCGTRIDELLKRDLVQEPLKAVFEPGPHIKTHLEVAKTVIEKQVGAEVTAELALGGDYTITASQMRLPLAPQNGKPLILSIFEFPPFEAHRVTEGQVALNTLEYRYIPL